MPRLKIHRLSAVVAFLGLLAGGASAQTTVAPALPTLRLSQVVPRIPTVHLFAVGQNEKGVAIPIQPSDLKALVGPDYLPVVSNSDDRIALVFLIDVSGSMKDQLDGIKDAIRWWIDSMGIKDQAAIVTLGSAVKTVTDFTNDKNALKATLASLHAQDKNTLLYQGMVQAMDLSRRLDANLPLRRAIVMLTDGMDDQQGGAGRQQMVDAMGIDPIPIYAIGASDRKPAVDAALKDFAALTYASGGAYRRVEIVNKGRPVPPLEQAYHELRDVVAQTRHFAADCKPCSPYGSPVAVRLRLTQGVVEVNSGTVTVLSVGTEGKAEPKPPPPQPQPPVSQAPVSQAPVIQAPVIQAPKEGPVRDDPAKTKEVKSPSSQSWNFNLDFFRKLPWQWLVLAGLFLAAAIAGLLVIFWSRRSSAPGTTRIFPEPAPTRPESDSNSVFSFREPIRSGAELHIQRLRMTQLGHNDGDAQYAKFEGELSVGRSGENDFIIKDTQVSGKHCTLSPKDGMILVRDSGSRNGTRVNGVPIEGFMHAEPDSILGVGRTEMRMQLLPPGQQ